MPAVVGRARDGGWRIFNRATGKVYGHSDSRKKAQSSARAINASEHGWKPTGKEAK